MPKFPRIRKKMWTFCKCALLLALSCAFVVWLRLGGREEQPPVVGLAYPAVPVVDAEGWQKLKEIQEEIISKSLAKPERIIKQPVGNDYDILKVQDPILPKPARPAGGGLTNKFDLEISADLAKIEPNFGRDGKAVRLTKEEEQKEVEKIMKKEAFNLIISDRIPYNRTLPDVR